jgi:hypothetical protein
MAASMSSSNIPLSIEGSLDLYLFGHYANKGSIFES